MNNKPEIILPLADASPGTYYLISEDQVLEILELSGAIDPYERIWILLTGKSAFDWSER